MYDNIADALAAIGDTPAYIIGGAELYKQALPLAGQLIITEVGLDAEGDTRFPPFGHEWQEASRTEHLSASGTPYALVRYVRSPGGA